ncbi:MAG: hypothetical protein ACM37W_02250 [Actinomycetota bacterium]
MENLFRFLMLRPADVAKPKDVKVLTASFIDKGVSLKLARREALSFVEKKSLLTSTDALTFATTAQAVVSRLEAAPMSADAIAAIVHTETCLALAEIVADPKFGADEALLSDSLVAMKLLSNSYGSDAPGFAKLIQGYDAIRLAASGRDPVSLRVLTITDFTFSDKTPSTSGRLEPHATAPVPAPHMPSDPLATIKNLDLAIATLKTLPASGFHLANLDDIGVATNMQIERLDTRLAALEHPVGKEPSTLSVTGANPVVTNPWLLSHSAISLLAPEVRNTLSNAGIDLQTQSLPVVLETLHTQRTEQLMMVEKAKMPDAEYLYPIGNSFLRASTNDYVGQPSAPFPTSHGSIRPVGIGDLLLVKQHVLRYEGGDLAHVENILKTEHLSRETRRLERTETTVFRETETTKEEQRDTQTTDRFSLKRETSDTIKTDSSFKAGVSVDAKYGPFVEVKANADFSTSTASESATKTASEFSKDVVSRSVSKLVERVLERRSTTTIDEFEEKYSHGFDNTSGSGHVSGYYQWIDKVMQAQVYNYGKRLLFDVTVPEPGTNYILAQTNAADQGKSLVKPPPFTLTADQINEGNYTLWAQKYGVVGLEPPPAPIKTVSKALDATVNANPHESSKSETLAIDEGYSAKYALFQRDLLGVDSNTGVNAKPQCRVLIGSNWIDAFGSTGYVDMSGEIGSVPFAYVAYKVELLAGTIEIFCEVTPRAITAWKLKTHAAIAQGYQAKLEAYNQALAQALAAAGTVISGRNPLFNAKLIANELRKQCLTLVTAQEFDAFGALELSSEGYAQPNLAATAKQMPYVRFFEQAFEWEHILYFFYPYFWGWKPAWNHRMLLDDTDPAFADFLRAGAARVVFPVRPGFEAAVVHYLETGEIWNGGPPPDISSSLYVPIIKEIQEATGAPGSEVPVGDPWLVHLPTTLVRLRPHDDLPTWQKVNEDWQPTN